MAATAFSLCFGFCEADEKNRERDRDDPDSGE
jgi:hypothetical protein